jgi:hypothetical protein
MFTVLTIPRASIHGVTWAGIDGLILGHLEHWATAAVGEGVASWVCVAERRQRILRQGRALLCLPPCTARSRIELCNAVASHCIAGGAERWSLRNNLVIQAEFRCCSADLSLMQLLAPHHAVIDLGGCVARNSVLIVDFLKQAFNHLKGDPLLVTIRLQLPHFLFGTLIGGCSLGKIAIEGTGHFMDLRGVIACLLLELSHKHVAVA